MAAPRQRFAFSAEIGFCRYEVGAHLKCLLGGRASVQNGEGDGVLVAGALAQAFQNAQSALQIVAVDENRVEFLGAQDFLSGTHAATHLDGNRQLLQRRLENSDNLEIPAEKQRFQLHSL